jgi:hypothetical protein
MDCDWINIPGQSTDDATVTIRKHGCPSSYNATNASFNDLAANCQDLQANVDFKLEPFDGNPGNQLTDQNGVVNWENISTGPGKVIETPPSGYLSIRVFCRQFKLTGEDTGFSEYPVTNFIMSYDLQPSYNLDCDWFNTYSPPSATPVASGSPSPSAPQPTPIVPTNPQNPQNPTGPTQTPTTGSKNTSLTIIKYTCDADYDVFKQNANPEKDCPQTTKGVQFHSVGKTVTADKTTDNSGKVAFTGLNSGPHKIVEDLPTGTAYAFIWSCTSNLGSFTNYPFFPFAIADANGAIGYNIRPGEQLVCKWYDVPSGTNAAVTITKRWCAGASPNPAACPIFEDGFEISLVSDDPATDVVTETTDNKGVASFDVQPGTYSIEEQGGQNPCFVDSDAVDADGNVTVGNEPVEIILYNCGPKP